jgi:hypothetical protein
MSLQLSDNLGLGVDAVPYLVLTFAPEWASRQARAVRDVTCARFTVQYEGTVFNTAPGTLSYGQEKNHFAQCNGAGQAGLGGLHLAHVCHLQSHPISAEPNAATVTLPDSAG